MSFNVTYKGKDYFFYVDGAGLDSIVPDRTTAGIDPNEHELFCKVVDEYRRVGLRTALVQAGATIKEPQEVKDCTDPNCGVCEL